MGPIAGPGRVRRRRGLLSALAVALAFLVSLAMPGASSAADSAGWATSSIAVADRPGSAVKPTIVFVHGAFADASGFAASIQDLQHAGYPVLAPANPLRGLVNDADSIRAFLSTIAGPIVLVGHSHGGAVITNAATETRTSQSWSTSRPTPSTRAKTSTTPTASAADTPTCWPTSTSVRSPASTRHRPRRATWTPTSDWDRSGRSSPPTFPTRPRP